jgi:hypothetical protein
MRKLLIVLAVVAVAIVVAVGVWRPGAGRSVDPERPGDGVEWLTGLLPASEVRADQLRGQACWDAAGNLTVPAGGTCTTRMPEGATRISLCLAEGALVALRVRGARYGGQEIGVGSLPCTGERRKIDLYDEASVLTVSCGPTVVCRLRLR